jgi:hypothetical protein
MSLQLSSFQALINSGAKIDYDDPVIQNILFDIGKIRGTINESIKSVTNRLVHARSSLRSVADFNDIKYIDTYEYDRVLDEVGNLLFDEIPYNTILTRPHIEWKEYFHGLYDLVVFPYHNDRTHGMIVIQESYKYFDVLKKPEPLSLFDPYYARFRNCEDLFNKLKMEHKKLMMPNMFKKLKRSLEKNVNARIRIVELEDRLVDLYKQKGEISRLLLHHKT